jgi:Protein of unknown function (DUF3142)
MKRPSRNNLIVWLVAVGSGLILYLGVIRPADRKAQLTRPAATLPSGRLDTLPHVILWAWERPEKLDFIDASRTGVAFLGRTLYLGDGDKVIVRPRLQPLNVPDGIPLIAVARIESKRDGSASLSQLQIESAAREIVELTRQPNIVAVQIDFDARASERKFYSELLATVRRLLPPTTALSITALASWCQGDSWLDQLPIDEAVPMLFRMGIDRTSILNRLATGEQFHSSLCTQSAGVATDEALPYTPATDRVYVFNPSSWSPISVKTVLERFPK